MPHNGPGRVLRATYGHFGEVTRGGQRMFAFSEDGRPTHPCPIGTPNHLTAAGILPVPPGDGNPVVYGTNDEPEGYAIYHPGVVWGNRGSVVRTPRMAVIMGQSIEFTRTDSAQRAVLFSNAARDAIVAGVSNLTAAGITVVFVRAVFSHAAQSPLVAPCFLTDANLVTISDGPDFGGASAYFYTADGRAAIGGDAYFAWLGGENRSQFGAYQATTTKSVFYDPGHEGAAPPVSLPAGWFQNGLGGGTVNLDTGEIYKESSTTGIWLQKLRADEQLALAAAGRCRSFRFAWGVNAFGGDVGAVPSSIASSDPDAMRYLLATGLNVGMFQSGEADDAAGNGQNVGNQILADMANFFGV